MNCTGKVKSVIVKSFENLLIIRPDGLESKNEDLAWTILANIFLWRLFDIIRPKMFNKYEEITAKNTCPIRVNIKIK